MTVGSPEMVTWADPAHKYSPDFATLSVKLPNGTFLAYTGIGNTDLLINGPKLREVLLPRPRTSLLVYFPYYATHNLEAAVWDPDFEILHGWVHVEAITKTQQWYHGEIQYTESRDGLTFNPSRFEYNGVGLNSSFMPYNSSTWCITSAGSFIKSAADIEETGTDNSGTGPHWALRMGDYIYMYWIDFWAENAEGQHGTYICVARSRWTDRGRPGTWWKWYRSTSATNDDGGAGGFTEPGVGGRCSAVVGIAGTCVVSVTVQGLQKQILISIPANDEGPLSISEDGLHWTRQATYLWPRIPKRRWNRQWFVGYTSILQDEDDRYWLYAMHLGPYSNYFRTTVRWPLSFHSATRPLCSTRYGLTRWRSYTNQLDLRTTIAPMDTLQYEALDLVGYTGGCYGDNTVGLVDCRVQYGAYFLATMDECEKSGRPAPHNASGIVVFMGALGTISSAPGEGDALVPLFRCYNSTSLIYDVSAVRPCSDGLLQSLLGWAEPASSSDLYSVKPQVPLSTLATAEPSPRSLRHL